MHKTTLQDLYQKQIYPDCQVKKNNTNDKKTTKSTYMQIYGALTNLL